MRHISPSVDRLISRIWDFGPRPNLMSMSFAHSVLKKFLCGVPLVVEESLDPTFCRRAWTSSDNQHWAICGNDEEKIYPSAEEKAGGRHEYCHLSTWWRIPTLLKCFTGISPTCFLGDRLISHRTDNPWLVYSPDLSPADYFLCGYLKERVYSNNP